MTVKSAAFLRNVRGDFRFRGRNTNPSGATSSGFRSFADFLLGLPDSTQRQVGADPADLVGWQSAVFIQDDWRITNRITLNLGLRYLQPGGRVGPGGLPSRAPVHGQLQL